MTQTTNSTKLMTKYSGQLNIVRTSPRMKVEEKSLSELFFLDFKEFLRRIF